MKKLLSFSAMLNEKKEDRSGNMNINLVQLKAALTSVFFSFSFFSSGFYCLHFRFGLFDLYFSVGGRSGGA